ncbi:MAG: M81 family metallopeptidase [Caulobacteraceae bacterium]|nr:M81 family metallopeptidase [Caulobacteraceae bacterium]
MKVFVASIATETNTFAPAPTGLAAFGGEAIFHAQAADEGANPFVDRLRALAASEGHAIAVGIAVEAEPSGATVRSVYERLRNHLIGQLREAMPVDAVILPLHGAMVAEGYPDCEGDLIESVRAVVGPAAAIGIELDLHCHFTERMWTHADVVIAFKEYPHTDMMDRLDEIWRLTLDTAIGKIKPIITVHDCRMVGSWHTTREPMKAFVRQMSQAEGQRGILSVNFGHGFPYGDTVDNGAKIWVVSDQLIDHDGTEGASLAARLGQEIWDMRFQTQAAPLGIDGAIDRMLAASDDRPVILADMADNSGGGAAGDSTFILARLVERGIGNVALGAFWDLGAIQICREAGVGAVLDLRIGGKCGPASGAPIDLRVTVRAIVEAHRQIALGISMPCGPSVWVSSDTGLDLVLISIRQQVFATDIFTALGIDLQSKRGIVVKSSQHFHAQFAPIGSDVLYVDTPGLLRSDFENLAFRHRSLNYWPHVENPFGREEL